ncbi:MAG: glycine transferase [Flavobacteriales bacterium]|nr:glycine transferase [Flavobacteriales bacterium]
MQPYFFPYLAYFSLIKHTDQFILFDPVQFIRHGWIERNRILKQNGGWLYIKVPLLKHSRDTIIKDIKINNEIKWQDKILAQLVIYKKKAPYYNEVITLLKELFSKEFNYITDLNKKSVELVCDYLGIEHDIQVFSKMDLEIETPTAPDEWALNICKEMGNVKEYWNAQGGEDFFNKHKYQSNGIELKFLNQKTMEYKQLGGQFEAGLSILDTMMFYSSEELGKELDRFDLK